WAVWPAEAEEVTVQMHRMDHVGHVVQDEADALAAADLHRGRVRIDLAADRPLVYAHHAPEGKLDDARSSAQLGPFETLEVGIGDHTRRERESLEIKPTLAARHGRAHDGHRQPGLA